MIKITLSLLIAVFSVVNFYGCKPAPEEEVVNAARPVFEREGPLPVLEQNQGAVKQNWTPSQKSEKHEEFVGEDFEVEISEEERELFGVSGD